VGSDAAAVGLSGRGFPVYLGEHVIPIGTPYRRAEAADGTVRAYGAYAGVPWVAYLAVPEDAVMGIAPVSGVVHSGLVGAEPDVRDTNEQWRAVEKRTRVTRYDLNEGRPGARPAAVALRAARGHLLAGRDCQASGALGEACRLASGPAASRLRLVLHRMSVAESGVPDAQRKHEADGVRPALSGERDGGVVPESAPGGTGSQGAPLLERMFTMAQRWADAVRAEREFRSRLGGPDAVREYDRLCWQAQNFERIRDLEAAVVDRLYAEVRREAVGIPLEPAARVESPDVGDMAPFRQVQFSGTLGWWLSAQVAQSPRAWWSRTPASAAIRIDLVCGFSPYSPRSLAAAIARYFSASSW
jgi:hypothetical protein